MPEIPPQFLIGVSPEVPIRTLPAVVPNFLKANTIPALEVFICSLYSLVEFSIKSLSETSIVLFPLSTIAFNFFEPITAPNPDLPAARPLSLITPDIKDKFSPA